MRDMNATFRHQTVTYADVLQYWNRKTGKDFTRLFDQYLTDTRIPVLQWQVKGGKLRYRWSNCIPGYEVPVRVKVDTSTLWLSPKTSWQFLNIKNLPKMGEIENYHGKNPGGLQPFVSIHPDFYCAAERFDGK
jgi:hypothetical protein